MIPAEIEAALQTAFNRCDSASCPLTATQKQILLAVFEEITRQQLGLSDNANTNSNSANPLDELEPGQLQAFLQFVQDQEQQNRAWKIQLLNDWLQERDSGTVQFIRENYGIQWLNQIKPVHFAKYAELAGEQAVKLKVGDRIEVSNGLWEWVQETGPCSREWFPCTIIRVDEVGEGDSASTNCIVRFPNGTEYEIQGMYQWNCYNWRWPE